MSKSTRQRIRRPKELDNDIIRLQKEGVKRADIAAQLSVPLTHVHKVLQRHGSTLTQEQRKANIASGRVVEYPEGTTERILALQKEGVSRAEIAAQVGVSIDKVHSDIQRHSTHILTREQRAALHCRFNDRQRQQVLEMRRAGQKMEDIVRSTKLSLSTVRYFCTQAGLKLLPDQVSRNLAHITEQQKKTIVRLRSSGVPIADVAREAGVGKFSAKQIIREAGVQVDEEIKRRNIQNGADTGRLKKLQRLHGVSSFDELMMKVAQDKGGVFVGPYVAAAQKAEWRCKKGHTFFTAPNYVTSAGTWCPKCAHTAPSHAQIEIFEYVKSLTSGEVAMGDRKQIAPKELDVWVPECRLGIEYDGLLWHSDYFQEKRGRHLQKAMLCRTNNVRLMAIYQDEWDNPNKREIVKAMIRWRMGKFQGTKLNARDLTLRRIAPCEELSAFFVKNHLEGDVRCKYAYVLRHKGAIVAAASFRVNFNNELELARLATDYTVTIRGGASKLLSKMNGVDLVSFSNNRWSEGDVYSKLGFDLAQESPPSYWYTDGFSRVWRYRCKRDNRPEILAQYPTEVLQAKAGIFSERLFGDDRALYRIEDYGHRKWIRHKAKRGAPQPQ